MRQAISVGKIWGIPIGLDYSWFLVFALVTWMLAASYFPSEFRDWLPATYWLTGAATAILLFASVLFHELGHSAVALRYKIPVRSITLFIFGGVAQIAREPPSASAEFLIAVAGPLVSLALALLFFLATPFVSGHEPLWAAAKYLAYINAGVFLFNLIPGYPLDGGRVLRAIIWAVTRNLRRATLIAANAGRFFGYLFIIVGAWQAVAGNLTGGLWVAFIGWFLESAASSQVHQAQLRGLLSGHRVADAMSAVCPTVGADFTIQQLVDEHILGGGRRCLLVGRGETVVGLMTLHQLKAVDRLRWATTTAGEAMIPLAEAKHVSPNEDLRTTLQAMDRDGVNQLLVTDNGRLRGMLSREDVLTYLRTLKELLA